VADSAPVRAARALTVVLAVAVLGTSACALTGGTLGGRDRCWGDAPLGASIWRGILEIDASGGRLNTPEGDVITLLPGALVTRVGGSGVGELVRGDEVVATAGEDVDLFGGMGADGALVVCAVEAKH
jgi:hypothetical protein